MTKLISYQGEPGAYSEMACQLMLPDYTPLPCLTFEDAFEAVTTGKAELGMIATENSIAGRVADVHSLLQQGNFHIVGECFLPIIHHLHGMPDAKLEDIKVVHSHVMSLAQCRKWIRDHGLQPITKLDNAGACNELANVLKDKSIGAIASELAGQMYGLKSLAVDIADKKNNTTRFLVLSREPKTPPVGSCPCMTTLLFRLRSVPAALYKALGGFATNGVNITKIESYLVDGRFTAARFHLDVEGHPEEVGLRNAIEELKFFAEELKILGTYPKSPFRTSNK
ncbi:MAG: prephenate dehydratase [Alphaproteobacteria bacterium]|nr:prephenate dehydratase [Alphaproteobacteria bacterium]